MSIDKITQYNVPNLPKTYRLLSWNIVMEPTDSNNDNNNSDRLLPPHARASKEYVAHRSRYVLGRSGTPYCPS